VTAGTQSIGTWPLDDVDLVREPGGLRMRVEDEDLLIEVRDPDHLLDVIGSSPPEPSMKAKKAKKPKKPKKPNVALTTRIQRQFDMETWRRRLGSTRVRWALAFGAVLAVLALGVFATGTLGMVLVLLGMVILVLAALAMSDDHTVYAVLPPKITETGLVIAGFALVFVGLPLVFFA